MFRLKSYMFIRFSQRFIQFSGLLLVCLIVRCLFNWPSACSVVSPYSADLSERALARLSHRTLFICLTVHSLVCLNVLCSFVWSYARSVVSSYSVHLLIIATSPHMVPLRLLEPTFKSRPPWGTCSCYYFVFYAATRLAFESRSLMSHSTICRRSPSRVRDSCPFQALRWRSKRYSLTTHQTRLRSP